MHNRFWRKAWFKWGNTFCECNTGFLCVYHTLYHYIPFSIAINFIQKFVRLMQKSNCLLKTWLTKKPVSCNNSEVILLILVNVSKRKDLPSVSNILWVFHSHFNRVIRVYNIVQWLAMHSDYTDWLYKYAFLSGCTYTSISLSSLVLITPSTLPFKFR